MWFKNLSLLRFTEPFDLDVAEFEQKLDQRRFRPCGSLEPVSYGWCAPLGKDTFPLVHVTNGFAMVCVRKEEKIVPASVVNEILSERVAEVEDRQGRPMRRKERDALRDEVMQDLLPRAFSHSRRTYAYIDPKGGWLVADSASAKKTEEIVSLLRQCLGSLPVVPPATHERPSAIMTHWIMDADLPSDITLESECELRSPEEDGGIVRCRRHDLSAPEIQNHIEAGKEVIKLAITWNDRLSFVLDEAFGIKKLRFLDLVQEEAADIETSDPVERFDADFAIMSLELATFLPRFIELFGGENLQTKQPVV